MCSRTPLAVTGVVGVGLLAFVVAAGVAVVVVVLAVVTSSAKQHNRMNDKHFKTLSFNVST